MNPPAVSAVPNTVAHPVPPHALPRPPSPATHELPCPAHGLGVPADYAGPLP